MESGSPWGDDISAPPESLERHVSTFIALTDDRHEFSWLLVDDRFVEYLEPGKEPAQIRLAVSLGSNEMPEGFLAPPDQGGESVLGLHNVLVAGRAVSIVDAWLTSHGLDGIVADMDKRDRAEAVLAAIDDSEYAKLCFFGGAVDSEVPRRAPIPGAEFTEEYR